MKVYIVFEHWDYEGSEVKGVFTTQQLADDEVTRLQPSDDDAYYSHRQTYYVKEYDVVSQ